MKYKLQFFLVYILLFVSVKSLFALHTLEMFGGSGIHRGSVSKESTLIAAGSKEEFSDSVSFSSTIFLGLRYQYMNPDESPSLSLGFELSGLHADSKTTGNWTFLTRDNSKNITNRTTLPLDSTNSPMFKIYRGTGLLGVQFPFNKFAAIEAGILGGLSFGEVSYNWQYTLGSTSGSSEGSFGAGFHLGARLGSRFFISDSLTAGFEYRYMAEFVGTFIPVVPIASDTDIASHGGHFFSASFGYRWGATKAE